MADWVFGVEHVLAAAMVAFGLGWAAGDWVARRNGDSDLSAYGRGYLDGCRDQRALDREVRG